MTTRSIAKQLGIAAAALQMAAQRIIGRSSERDPVISLAITKDDLWVVENHGRSIAYDLKIQPVTFIGITASFPEIPVLSSIHPATLLPALRVDNSEDEAYKYSIGPLSQRKHNIREILSRQWADTWRSSENPPSEQFCPISLRYRNVDGWYFTVTADLVLRIGSGELAVRNIRNDSTRDREA